MEYIKSKDNPKIKNFAKLLTDKKYRKQTGLFVLEGEKLLSEACDWGQKIDTLIMSEDFKSDFRSDYEQIDANIIIVPHYLFEKIADTKSPQGVMFSCFMGSDDLSDYPKDFFDKLKRVIILDNLQDPGNMGTIIRTAAAFNIDAVISLNNSVDHYSPKVVRSTMNGIFNVPIINMTVEDCFKRLKLPIYATYLDNVSEAINDVDMSVCAVIIGNESKGISNEVVAFADKKIIIPINNVESLNASVAASIVMWEMSKGI